jgi:hypothetical protein
LDLWTTNDIDTEIKIHQPISTNAKNEKKTRSHGFNTKQPQRGGAAG